MREEMLTRIELENFKCFKNISVELSNLNVLTGINSMGKSSIVQALLLLRQSFENQAIKTGLHLNGKYVQIGTGYDILRRNSEEEVVGIDLTATDKISFKYDYEKNADFLKLKNGITEFLTGINLFSSAFSYISAARIGPQRYYESSYYEVNINNQVGTRGEFFAGYLVSKADDSNEKGVTLPFTLTKHESCSSNKLIDQANAWLSEISPGITLVSKKDPEIGVVSLQYKSLRENYSPVNVGFGLSYVAPIVISLLKAQEDELLIIENPEAHLHPRGQRRMGELIAKVAACGAQIIVETHSDHLLNGIRLSVKGGDITPDLIRLNYFFRESRDRSSYIASENYEYKKVSPTILPDGRLSDWPKGFFDEWDNALMELF